MALALLAAFVAVPILEIAAFVEVGGRVGLWPTLGLVVATALAGSTLLRIQGLSVWRRFRQSLMRNELPVAEAFDGLGLVVGGAFLLTPGFLTDAAGFALLIPPVRRLAAQGLLRWLLGRGHAVPGGPGGPVIDGEFEEVGRDAPPRR